MPKINDIIFCLKARNADNDGVSAQTILSAITPEYIPGLFSFSVVVIVLDIDLTQTHEFRVIFETPSCETIVDICGEFPIIFNNTNLPPEHLGINVAMEWNNVNFKMSGLHTIKIFIDGKLIQSKEIFVKGKNE